MTDGRLSKQAFATMIHLNDERPLPWTAYGSPLPPTLRCDRRFIVPRREFFMSLQSTSVVRGIVAPS
jgi:hypothetical protein